jgi:hypothetical protein
MNPRSQGKRMIESVDCERETVTWWLNQPFTVHRSPLTLFGCDGGPEPG